MKEYRVQMDDQIVYACSPEEAKITAAQNFIMYSWAEATGHEEEEDECPATTQE